MRFSLAFVLPAATLTLANPMQTAAPELPGLEKRACAADNCLRALQRNILTAAPFCETYTQTTAAPIPTWAANCQQNPTRVSSACGCLATGTLTKVYGPVDNTNYTIWEQATNIRSLPGVDSTEIFNYCRDSCISFGVRCQTFSVAQMPANLGGPGGLYLCYT
ncbi:hypothetical protein GQ44DRAFT_704621 [Phaeosphaeriaceae sp. PMI808]|nr:hypothetical protein GQ44DRAFT_704621 [Phaeosphaeriaceae sp. PMI808]